MKIEFDPAKDAANLARHGVSLSRATELAVVARVVDPRYSERRLRAYGVIEGQTYCLAYTLRGEVVRLISLRQGVSPPCLLTIAPAPPRMLH